MPALNLDEDSEFRDALIAKGIIDDPRPKTPPSPSSFLPTDEELLHHTLALAEPSTLQQLAEEADSDEERLFESYRQKRLAELTREEKRGRFGSVKRIGRGEWAREVTEGSLEEEPAEDGAGEEERRQDRREVQKEEESESESEEESDGEGGVKGKAGKGKRAGGKAKVGTGVVCCLYKDGQPESTHLLTHLTALAPKFPRTKFISIIGSQAIENYPDRNLPTLIVYRAGEVMGQIVGGTGVLGKGRERDIQTLLSRLQAILPSHMPVSQPSDAASESDSDGSDEEWGGLRRKDGESRGIRNGVIRGRDLDERDGDESDDFDL